MKDVLKDVALTPGQQELAERLEAFLNDPQKRCFLLKGYAGTGKTFFIKRIADYLKAENRAFSLLAPTGRAARVLRERTQYEASTVHRAIYAMDRLVEHEQDDERFKFMFGLRDVAMEDIERVFIVDESSMVGDREAQGEFLQFGSGRLLKDLITFTRLKIPDINSKLIFVGDPAQLPPVTDGNESPALSAPHLQCEHGVTAEEFELRDVVRQKADSAINRRATAIRESLMSGWLNQLDLTPEIPAISAIKPKDVPVEYMEEQIVSGQAVVITYSNTAALHYNKAIRARLFRGGEEDPPKVSDRLLVACNNAKTGLLNGDLLDVVEVQDKPLQRVIPMRGQPAVILTFREVRVRMISALGAEALLSCVILEDLLLSKDRDISREQQQALYVDFKMRNPKLRPNTAEFRNALQDDPFFNAVRVKYGHALTCHKAQGGEWERVIVIFEGGGTSNLTFFRWCYTAITRARRCLYTVNAPQLSPVAQVLAPLANRPQIAAVIEQVPEQAPAEPDVKSVLQEDDYTADRKLLFHKALAFEHDLAAKGLRLVKVEHDFAKWFERFHVAEGSNQAILQVYFNARGTTRKPTRVPSASTSAEVFDKAAVIFEAAVPGTGTGAPFALDPEVVREKPFIRDLIEGVRVRLAGSGIELVGMDQRPYLVQVGLRRGGEACALNFYYEENGTFTAVQAPAAKDSSVALLRDAQKILCKEKAEDSGNSGEPALPFD